MERDPPEYVENLIKENRCLVCEKKIEDGFEPTLEQEYLYHELGEEYSYLDHKCVDRLYLCKKCEEEFRKNIWEIFSQIQEKYSNNEV